MREFQVESLGLKVECPVIKNNVQIVCLVNDPDARVPEKGIKLVARGTGQDADRGLFRQLDG